MIPKPLFSRHTVQFCTVLKSLFLNQFYLHLFFAKLEVVLEIQVLLSCYYHVQNRQVSFAATEKGKLISSQFASERKYCSLIVIPTRLKKFSSQSLNVSQLPLVLACKIYNRQTVIIRATLHFVHRSLKSCSSCNRKTVMAKQAQSGLR